MDEKFQLKGEYKFIKPSEYLTILKDNSLWYLDPKITSLLQTYIQESHDKPDEWKETKKEMVTMFSEALEQQLILLGERPEGFNDDDRWDATYNPKANPQEGNDKPDTAVIHHTSSTANVSYAYLNALGLLRLYVPLYRDGFPDYKEGQHTPIASGYFYQEKQTFLGYHFLVRNDGSIEQPLRLGYTGFHCGSYPINCRSIGIAIVEDLSEKTPTDEAIDAVRLLLNKFSPKTILGHQEVKNKKGEPTAENCPGKSTWEMWKPKLFA